MIGYILKKNWAIYYFHMGHGVFLKYLLLNHIWSLNRLIKTYNFLMGKI